MVRVGDYLHFTLLLGIYHSNFPYSKKDLGESTGRRRVRRDNIYWWFVSGNFRAACVYYRCTYYRANCHLWVTWCASSLSPFRAFPSAICFSGRFNAGLPDVVEVTPLGFLDITWYRNRYHKLGPPPYLLNVDHGRLVTELRSSSPRKLARLPNVFLRAFRAVGCYGRIR